MSLAWEDPGLEDMNYARSKQAGISLAWETGEVWEGKWKPQYLQRVRKITSAKTSGMPGPGEDETCREERAARENPGSTDTPGIVGEKGLSTHAHPQDSKEPVWWTHSRKEQAEEERPSHFQVPQRVLGASWSGGKALQIPDFPQRHPCCAQSCLRLMRPPWAGVAGTKKDHSRKRWIPSLLHWRSSLPPCYTAKIIPQRQGLI